MKSIDRFTCLTLIISFSITIFGGYFIWQGYYGAKNEICKKMEVVFDEAIKKEIEMFRIAERVISYENSQFDKDSIQKAERAMHCDLEQILQNYQERYSLDSLFRLNIVKSHIQARSAVRSKSRFGVTDSSSDSMFYKEAVQLPLVIFRPRSDSEKQPVELQAYVQVPFLFILKQVPALGFMLFLWMLINSILWGVYFFWPRYRYRMLANNKTVEIQTVVEEKIVEVQKFIPVQSFTKKNVFPSGFQFDKNTGLMAYNEQTVKLTKQSLKLFCYFLDVKQSMLTYKDIGKFLFNLDGDDPKVQSRTSTTITRLRESLISFPFIQIEAIRGIGYQLHIDCSEIVETDVAKPDNTDVV